MQNTSLNFLKLRVEEVIKRASIPSEFKDHCFELLDYNLSNRKNIRGQLFMDLCNAMGSQTDKRVLVIAWAIEMVKMKWQGIRYNHFSL